MNFADRFDRALDSKMLDAQVVSRVDTEGTSALASSLRAAGMSDVDAAKISNETLRRMPSMVLEQAQALAMKANPEGDASGLQLNTSTYATIAPGIYTAAIERSLEIIARMKSEQHAAFVREQAAAAAMSMGTEPPSMMDVVRHEAQQKSATAAEVVARVEAFEVQAESSGKRNYPAKRKKR